MKIFMAAELTGAITVRIVNDKGEWCGLIGKRSDDCMPVFGCELEEGQEKNLREWLQRTETKEENPYLKETILKKTCCGTEWSYVSCSWSEARCHLCGAILNE